MSDFRLEIGPLLEAEGGSKYTNRPNDLGGPTKWGVTLSTLEWWRGKDLTAEDVKNLTKDEAIEIYKALFWDKNRTSEIYSQLVAKILFNQSVNRGYKTAAKMLQVAVHRAGGPRLSVDGDVGPKTLAAVNSGVAVNIALEFLFEAQDQYVDIAKSRLSQLENISGWINRTQELLKVLVTELRTGSVNLNLEQKVLEAVEAVFQQEKSA